MNSALKNLTQSRFAEASSCAGYTGLMYFIASYVPAEWAVYFHVLSAIFGALAVAIPEKSAPSTEPKG